MLTESNPTSTTPAFHVGTGASLVEMQMHRVAVTAGAPVPVPPGPQQHRQPRHPIHVNAAGPIASSPSTTTAGQIRAPLERQPGKVGAAAAA